MSRFKGIFEARRQQEPEVTAGEAEASVETPAPPSPAPPEAVDQRVKRPERKAVPKPPDEPPAESKRRGRPAGKRSDSEYGQVTAYIRKDTHLAVKLALLKEGGTKEFSELVEELLSKWVKSRT